VVSETFGTSPKQFARIVRVGDVVSARRKGKLSWAEAASACGFADQAHLIKDFTGLIGAPPEAFFRKMHNENTRKWDSALCEFHFYNLFLVCSGKMSEC
jgi:AraC-like DNA-binding protein